VINTQVPTVCGGRISVSHPKTCWAQLFQFLQPHVGMYQLASPVCVYHNARLEVQQNLSFWSWSDELNYFVVVISVWSLLLHSKIVIVKTRILVQTVLMTTISEWRKYRASSEEWKHGAIYRGESNAHKKRDYHLLALNQWPVKISICHCKRKTSVIIYLFHCKKRRKKYCLDELEYVTENHNNLMVAWRPKGSLLYNSSFPTCPLDFQG
jgi:hypothetical protein